MVGFDDSPWATQSQPPLSTVRHDAAATGTLLADLLLRQINGEDLTGHHEILPNRVVWRNSAGAIPTDA